MGWMKKKETETPTEEIEEIKPIKKAISEKEIKDVRWIVVKELPVKPIREYIDEKGVEVHFITVEEALTEMLNQ